MIVFNELQSLIANNLTQNLADSVCIRLGYGYEVDFKDANGELSAEDIFNLVQLDRRYYQFRHWKELAAEIEAKIRSLKDDTIGLNRFLREEILTPLNFELWFFYGDNSDTEKTVFQTIVSSLITNNCTDDVPPKDLFLLHEREINKMSDKNPKATSDELANLLMDNITFTLKVFPDRFSDPFFNKCRYLSTLLKRLASIIEGNLLKYNCSHDLFACQKASGIILYPYLTADDIIHELSIPRDYFLQLSRGYTCLDKYTEFAGFGIIEPGDKIPGVSFSGIPEIDALLKEANSTGVPFYPKQHAHRNRWHFEQYCEELMNSNMPQERKERIIFELVHILCYCYSIFKNNPQKKDLLPYAMVYFGSLDIIAMRAPNPICITKYCIELHAEDILTDPFFDSEEQLANRKELSDPHEPWSEYTRRVVLSKSLDYYESRLCQVCEELSCHFRKADTEGPLLTTDIPKNKRNTSAPDFIKAYKYVCEYLSKKQAPYVYQEKGSLQWRFDDHVQLYAYVGLVIKQLLMVSQIPWDGIITVVHSDGNKKHLKELASKYKKELSKKGHKDLPEGYRLVDEAIESYRKRHKKRERGE